jgi:hypothetical protein
MAVETQHPEVPWLEPIFFENQKRVTPESLLPFAGQHVAWSWDGSRILASDSNPETLRKKLKEGGFDCGRVVFAYVDELE